MTQINTATWMSNLSDSKRLDGIMMPGSHDAGMSELHHCAPPIGGGSITQTQGSNIAQQLLDGSRYFDIRVDYDYGELVTYHRTDRWGCNGQSLREVLNQTMEFLETHFHETVFLKFSHIRDSNGHDPAEIKQKINAFLDNYSAYIYTNSNANVNLALEALGNVRGKMILVFDYNEYINPAGGRFRYHDGSSPQSNLTVFDQYSNTSNYTTMSTDQINKWRHHGGFGQGFFFLLSWTLTGGLTTPSIKDMAAEANRQLPSVLQNQIEGNNLGKPNVVYIDFMNGQTAQSIIQHNFE